MIDYSRRASIGLVKRIPSGYVRLGSRFHPREEPPHNVNVREFQITHVSITVNQYAVFLQSGAMDEKRWWSAEGWAWRQGETDGWGREDHSRPDGWSTQKNRYHHPVTGVTWYEAEAYCKWIAHLKKRSVRLPTEEEWERAARGNGIRPFPWGEDFDPARTNTLEGERGTTVPAGSLDGDASPFGVYDMAGNVQEWTGSAYDPLPNEKFPPGDLRVVRGGSYNDTAYGARTSYRRAYPAGYFYPYLGFRVVVGIR
ncbi:MAG: formylglycine-generating enzyme family protein [Anaerolineales bacterium]